MKKLWERFGTLIGGALSYPSLLVVVKEQDFFGFLSAGAGIGTLLGLFLQTYVKREDFAALVKRVWPPMVWLVACVVLYFAYVIFYEDTTGPTSGARRLWIGLDVLLLSVLWSTVIATLVGQGGRKKDGPPTP